MEMMDHLMAEKLTKIIKRAKWGKSHQKSIFKKVCSKNIHSKLHRAHVLLGKTLSCDLFQEVYGRELDSSKVSEKM